MPKSSSESSSGSDSRSSSPGTPAVGGTVPMAKMSGGANNIAKVVNFDGMGKRQPPPMPGQPFSIPQPTQPPLPAGTGPDANFFFRFLLLPKYCGAIIGRGGQNVNHLSEQTGVHVQINNYTSEREAQSGPAREYWREVIVSGGVKNVHRGIQDMFKLLLNDAQELQIKVLVLKTQIGVIIGKGGNAIKNIRETTGCRLKAFSEEEIQYYAPDRVVQIEGPTIAVGEACQGLVDLLGKLAIEKRIGLREQSVGKGARGASEPSDGPDNYRGTKRDATGSAKTGSSDVTVHMPASATTIIPLTKTQASMIIGRGGCTINQVRAMCTSKVAVDEKPDGSRELVLAGALDQVEAGINLIRQIFQHESYDPNAAAAMPAATEVPANGAAGQNGTPLAELPNLGCGGIQVTPCTTATTTPPNMPLAGPMGQMPVGASDFMAQMVPVGMQNMNNGMMPPMQPMHHSGGAPPPPNGMAMQNGMQQINGPPVGYGMYQGQI